MNYKKFHQLIEKQNPEEKEALYARLKQKLNLPDEEPEIKKESVRISFFKKPYRIAAAASAVLVAVFLAVFIPLSLKCNMPQYRYCYSENCIDSNIKSVKDYAEENNLPLLYLDSYERAEKTLIYFEPDSSNFVYISEEYKNEDENIKLYITDNLTKVDFLENQFQNFNGKTEYNGVVINWSGGQSFGIANFEYDGYSYYLHASNTQNETRIIQIAQMIIP